MAKRKKTLKFKPKAKMKTETTKEPKTKNKEVPKKQFDKKLQIASALNWAAIAVFVVFGIMMFWSFFSWEDYASDLDEQTLADLEDMEITLDDLKTALLYIGGICIVSAILIFLLKTGIEKKKIGWGWLLGLSIFFTLIGFSIIFTLAPGILSLIASVLYATKKK